MSLVSRIAVSVVYAVPLDACASTVHILFAL